MTRRSWISSLFLGLGACCLSGCLFGGNAPTVEKNVAEPERTPKGAGSAYHAHEPPPFREDKPGDEAVAQVHYPDAPAPGGSAPSVKPDNPPSPPDLPPAPPEPAAMHVEKAPPDPQLVAALRCLLEKRSADALALLQNYDGPSRELLLTLLPLTARVGDGGLEHATPQETAVVLEQLRLLETVLRPRAALTLDKVCFCRKINGFGDCEPWPENHVFQAGADGVRGERMQVYVEVRNFTSRLHGAMYETSLAGQVEIRDFANKLVSPVSRIDFPAYVDRSQTPRQDYFINFQFHLPSPMPAGRYTLRVLVKDVLDPATGDDASPRSAGRSLDFLVGAPGDGRD
jgi:hypothetical protein